MSNRSEKVFIWVVLAAGIAIAGWLGYLYVTAPYGTLSELERQKQVQEKELAELQEENEKLRNIFSVLEEESADVKANILLDD